MLSFVILSLQIRTDYKLCKEEKEKLDDDIKQEVDRREKLEGWL
jgi:hypothetical protein